MGVFKGVGFPDEIGEFFRLADYDAWTWIGHARFPTNTPGWWGGAHPFTILDWSVVHNGEISSYGINKRYLETFGYECTMQTDSEVVAYLFDLLIRRHNMPLELVPKVVASGFWKNIDLMDERERELNTAIRQVYASALVNGPFAVILGHEGGMIGLSDRVKLRPMVAASRGDWLYISSEEAGIREMCARPDKVWLPRAGELVVGRLRGESDESDDTAA
jgi:glutamate synthase domain-containing protein 1